MRSIQDIEDFIKQNHIAFLYVSRPNCSVCHALWPQVDTMLQINFPLIKVKHINADNIHGIAGYLSIFTVPVLLLYIDGKELLREARFVHMDEFQRKLQKIYELNV
ncbi:thioredoxin family protein [Bacillus sp. HMF5848]|uniref:thioredoxin family protein n=1 Tax=Bacillus sp. HMF5848 TaxID=2495421 RepID=UPI0026A17500